MRMRYLLVCLLLVSAGPLRADSEETDYLALFMEGKKVGHAIENRVAADGKVTTTENVDITINRGGVQVSMQTMEKSVETADGRPLAFEMAQQLSFLETKVAGTIDENGVVNMTVTSMGTEQKQSFDWPKGAVMAEGLRLLTLKKGLEEGTTYKVSIFSPSAMQVLDADISIGPEEEVDLLGRVVKLRKVVTGFSMPGAGQFITTSYIDGELHTQKCIMPVAGIRVEMIACAKEFALGENDVFEAIGRMLLESPRPLDDVRKASSITYHLEPTDTAGQLPIPSTDNQSVRRLDDGTVLVVVRPAVAPKGARFPYRGKDKTILEAMEPSRFVQSDRKEIIELARRAVGRSRDAAEAAGKIEAFVAEYVENKSLSVGYASAAEVAASRQGDCSEFAVLTAALCRAVGIPAQVVTGVAYVKDFAGYEDRFGGHAWTQAYIGGDPASRKPGKWIGLDAAFKSAGLGGYEPGHIALAVGNGDPEDFFNLISTVGHFRIAKITVER